MTHPYFNYLGSRSLQELAQMIACDIDTKQDTTLLTAADFAAIQDAQDNEITFLANLKYAPIVTPPL